METIHQIYDPVGETDIEDKQCVAPAVKYSANREGQCHVSMQSKTKAERYSLWFINNWYSAFKNKSTQWTSGPNCATGHHIAVQ